MAPIGTLAPVMPSVTEDQSPEGPEESINTLLLSWRVTLPKILPDFLLKKPCGHKKVLRLHPPLIMVISAEAPGFPHHQSREKGGDRSPSTPFPDPTNGHREESSGQMVIFYSWLSRAFIHLVLTKNTLMNMHPQAGRCRKVFTLKLQVKSFCGS